MSRMGDNIRAARASGDDANVRIDELEKQVAALSLRLELTILRVEQSQGKPTKDGQ